jgi:hypothetical protein
MGAGRVKGRFRVLKSLNVDSVFTADNFKYVCVNMVGLNLPSETCFNFHFLGSVTKTVKFLSVMKEEPKSRCDDHNHMPNTITK